MGVIHADTDVADIDLEVWDHVMTVNLRGYVATMKRAILRLLDRGGGADRQHVLSSCIFRRTGSLGVRDSLGGNRRAHTPYPVAVG